MARLRLRVLGGASVLNGSLPLGPAAAQPKRLALLGLLAVAGDRGLSREQLLAYLWPDADEARARNALSQTVFALRRDLGADEVIEGSTTLRLNPLVIESDLREFDEALRAGQLERAIALYEGPLLSGPSTRPISRSPEGRRSLPCSRARTETARAPLPRGPRMNSLLATSYSLARSD